MQQQMQVAQEQNHGSIVPFCSLHLVAAPCFVSKGTWKEHSPVSEKLWVAAAVDH